MKKCLICLLLTALMLLLCACAGEGTPELYEVEHEHSYGASFDVAPADGVAVTEQVRYCKICHAEQVHPKE